MSKKLVIDTNVLLDLPSLTLDFLNYFHNYQLIIFDFTLKQIKYMTLRQKKYLNHLLKLNSVKVITSNLIVFDKSCFKLLDTDYQYLSLDKKLLTSLKGLGKKVYTFKNNRLIIY